MTKNACVPNTAEILKMSYITMYVIFDFSFFWTFSTFPKTKKEFGEVCPCQEDVSG